MSKIISACPAPTYLRLSALKFHPENPRTIEPERLKDLKQSIVSKGVYKPLLIWKKGNIILEGNHRVRALRELEAEGYLLKPPGVPVVILDIDEAMAKRILIESNTSYAHWIDELLRKQLSEAVKAGEDVREYGLTEAQVEAMLGDAMKTADEALKTLDTESTASDGEDDVPEPPKLLRAKVGDVFVLGRHRLMCGDATVASSLAKLMDGAKADMVFTDPPYGMNLDTNYDTMFGKDSTHVKTGDRFKKVKGDDVDYDPSPILAIKAKDHFIWGADYFYDKLPPKGSLIAWDKRDEALDRVPGNTTEFCWSKNPKRRMSVRLKWSGHHGMQKDDTKKRVHPTQKPTALAEWFFEQWGKDAKNIVDIYGGSGSTLIACEKTERHCFMMELDPSYIDTIIARWQDFTSESAYLLDGKKRVEWDKIKGRKP